MLLLDACTIKLQTSYTDGRTATSKECTRGHFSSFLNYNLIGSNKHRGTKFARNLFVRKRRTIRQQQWHHTDCQHGISD